MLDFILYLIGFIVFIAGLADNVLKPLLLGELLDALSVQARDRLDEHVPAELLQLHQLLGRRRLRAVVRRRDCADHLAAVLCPRRTAVRLRPDGADRVGSGRPAGVRDDGGNAELLVREALGVELLQNGSVADHHLAVECVAHRPECPVELGEIHAGGFARDHETQLTML